jgi:glycosyltransferase involved in cell wall biosynthesis
MPVHQGARWLEETLASVAAEECSGIELIIGDSSEDLECAAIVRRYTDRLDIDYRHCPDVKSWTRKTNQAAMRARAPHIAMLHQDDLWLPGRTGIVRAAIASHPEASLVLTASQIIDEHNRPLGLWRCPLPAGTVTSELLLERLLVQNFVAIPAPIIRRDAWSAVGGLDESLWYTPDWDLYLKLAQQGVTVYRPEATTAFRIHSSSLTVTGSRNRADFTEQMLTVVHRHIGAVAPERRDATLKRALASCTINDSLAAAALGAKAELLRAGAALFRLTPVEAARYFRDSRIFERVWPRLRARVAGAF